MQNINQIIFSKVKVVAVGTLIGQIITVLAYPFISRLYHPNEFGIFASYIAVISILSSALSLRFDYLILLSAKKSTAIKLFHISIFFILMNVILISVISVLYFYKFFDRLKVPYYLVIIGALFASVQQSVVFLGVKYETFKEISTMRLLQNSSTSFFQLIGFPFGAYGLIFGDMIGRSVSSINAFIQIAKKWKIVKFKFNHLTSYKTLFDENRTMAFGLLCGNFMYMFSQQIPVPFLNAHFNSFISGSFGLCVRLTGIPIALLGQTYQNVYNSELRNQYMHERNHAKMVKSYTDVIFNLCKLYLLPALVICLASRFVFPILFGKSWALAGEIMLYLFPIFICELTIYPVFHTFIIVNQYEKYIKWEIFRTLTIIILIILTQIANLSYVFYIFSYSITMSLAYIILAVLQYRFLKYENFSR